jgi:hypothetical protein
MPIPERKERRMKNKYIGFTVRQALEDIKQKGVYDSVRMGAEDGNGFIYCGPIDEDAILKEADKARAQTLELISKNLDQFRSVSSGLAEMTTKKAFSELKKMVFAPLSEEEENEKKKNGKPTTADKFKLDVAFMAGSVVEQVITEHMNKYGAKLNAINKDFNRLRPWVDIMERPVADVYKSIEEKRTAIIIFRGYEEGDYWDYSEYRRAQNRKALFDKWLEKEGRNT